jgi:hypothetical protein
MTKIWRQSPSKGSFTLAWFVNSEEFKSLGWRFRGFKPLAGPNPRISINIDPR